MFGAALSKRTLTMWRSRLISALRTTLACAVVACAKYYTPPAVGQRIAFPALSYVTAILIVTDATLGDALIGLASAVYATLQGVVPAVLTLWVVGPSRLTIASTTAAVAVSSFFVALPESTSTTSKRIALAQIVIVYVTAFKGGAKIDPVRHPMYLGVSAIVGGLAAVVALLVPYPSLGYPLVREKSKLFIEISLDKLGLLVNAFCAENYTSAAASVSQAKSMTKTTNKLLKIIRLKEKRMQWESPLIRRMTPHLMRWPSERLQALEMPLKGLEIALTSCLSFPIKMARQELKPLLFTLANNISQTLAMLKHPNHVYSSTLRETKEEMPDKSLQFLHATFPTHQDLPSFFFLFCLKLLHDETLSPPRVQVNLVESVKENTDSNKQEYYNSIRKRITNGSMRVVSMKRFTAAIKCSLTLGLAVLFGILFSKENGYWGGLTVAVAMTPMREPTYRASNVRVQGTVLGSVYGILGSYISQSFIELRVLVLLPWFIFTSFLRCSQMYGPAGGISAAIAAILIMGRKNIGPANGFAIMRISETLIALFCFVFVELLFQPTRASTQTKIQFSKTLKTLHGCIESMVFGTSDTKLSMREETKKLKGDLIELGKFIDEAEMEPSFWFLPFPGPCYRKLFESLSKIVKLLLFGIHSIEFLLQHPQGFGVEWKEMQQNINGDLELFQKVVSPSIKCLEEVTRLKSLAKQEVVKIKVKNIYNDLESGKSPNADIYKSLCADEAEMDKIVDSFLQHSKEATSKIQAVEGDVDEKADRVVLCFGALGFCMDGLIKHIREIERGVVELLQWENPSSHINLYDVSCKVNDLAS